MSCPYSVNAKLQFRMSVELGLASPSRASQNTFEKEAEGVDVRESYEM